MAVRLGRSCSGYRSAERTCQIRSRSRRSARDAAIQRRRSAPRDADPKTGHAVNKCFGWQILNRIRRLKIELENYITVKQKISVLAVFRRPHKMYPFMVIGKNEPLTPEAEFPGFRESSLQIRRGHDNHEGVTRGSAETTTQTNISSEEYVTASLDRLQNEGLIPIVTTASMRQRIEWPHTLQYLAIQLDACECRQEVVKLSGPQLPLGFIQFPLAIVNLAHGSPFAYHAPSRAEPGCSAPPALQDIGVRK